ncbi:MAG: YdeI/OmpD-associated family protein [Theionarchaea archaeon]|nr:YdeI/OmpD-associated family protein [Theionarchaea archaeon]
MITSLYVTSRDQWRAWLEKNHETMNEIWLIFYKKDVGKPTISYDDAVEEALCYGWIDSNIKRIDSEKYVRKFTPRKEKSNWSNLNKKRVRKMIQEGKMTEAGLAKIDERVFVEEKGRPEKFIILPEIEKNLQANEKAWKNFSALAPGYKRQYIGWVMSAKRGETRKRRLKELITVLEKNEKLGMK